VATVVLRVLPLGGNGWQQLRGLLTRVSGGTGACGPHGLADVIWSAGGTSEGELDEQHYVIITLREDAAYTGSAANRMPPSPGHARPSCAAAAVSGRAPRRTAR
jgi:hypothetical protein